MPGHETTVCKAGVAQGRRDCEREHREARKAWRHAARIYLERHSLMVSARAVSRGRLQGAAVAMGLVAVAVWFGRWGGR